MRQIVSKKKINLDLGEVFSFFLPSLLPLFLTYARKIEPKPAKFEHT
jgi:hypothetical protein